MEHKPFCESVRTEIRATYAEVAASVENHFKYPVGKESACQLGYPHEVLQQLPSETSRHFCGVGNPFSLGPLRPGESVLDVGCGAGFDSLVAASLVGPNGSVVGIDLTEAMIHRAQVNLQAVPFSHVRFLLAGGEEIPLPDCSMDVVISNGAINLSPDKEKVLSEIYRVTRPRGRLMMADMLLEDGVAPETVAALGAWSH
jgi:SAM-dependent methyltransferase